jgi:hypothetical protein
VIGLVIGLVVLVVVVIALVIAGDSSEGGIERIVRCGSGHLFTSTVVPGASLKAVRLGTARFQRCPVAGHWSLVRRVNASTLTPQELAAARSIHDVPIP